MNRTHNPTDSAATADDPSVVTPATTLRGAAHYLTVHGWNQAVYYASRDTAFPPACAIGAIAMAVYGRREDDPFDALHLDRADVSDTVDALSDYLTHTHAITDWDACDLVTIDVADWNDEPERTPEQVIIALRDAADEWDYDHASEDDLDTYADACAWAEEHPTREGFLAWLGARR